MKFANISNNMYVNQYDGETRITCFGMTPAGIVDLFSVPISTPSGQVQISKEPILGKTRAINDIMQKQGNLGGSTSGEVQIATKTASFSIKNDYAYLSPVGVGIEVSRNTLEAILSGDGFTDSLNSVYRKVVGTNGTIKKSATTDQNYIFKKLFEIDGRLRVADASTLEGHAITMKNIRTPAYDKSCVYMVFESIYKYDDDNIDGIRLVYTMNSEVSVGDATDANEVSFTQTQLCDVRNIKSFLINGFGDDEVGTTTASTVTIGVPTNVDLLLNTLKFSTNILGKLNVGDTITVDAAGDILPKTLTVKELTYAEGADITTVEVNEDITAGTVVAGNIVTTVITVTTGVPARPSMISKTAMSTFKAVINDSANINVVSNKLVFDINPPTDIVKLNSTTQEYETVPYTPVAKDIAVVYIPKTVLQEYIDSSETVKADASVYALAIFSGSNWEVADAGNIKESKILDGTAVTTGTYATALNKKSELAKRTYRTLTWNFEKAAFEYI